MNMRKVRRMLAVSLGMYVLSVAIPATAANIQLLTDNSGGQDWSQANDWSDNSAAVAGNDYYVDRFNASGLFSSSFGDLLRSPNLGTTASSVFPGDALHLLLGGQFALKQADGEAVTINNLIVDEGRINAAGGTTGGPILMELAGNLAIGPGGVNFSSNSSEIVVSSAITGFGPIIVMEINNAAFPLDFTGSLANWTGDFIIDEDDVVVTVTFDSDVSFDDVDLQSMGILNLGTQNLVANSLTINGVDLGSGVFTSADSPQLIGSGSISVVPEPSTCLLMLLSGIIAMGGGVRVKR